MTSFVNFSIPSVIPMEELKAAKMPRMSWNALNRVFPDGLDMARVEREGSRFLNVGLVGKRAMKDLALYLYGKYGYRFPPEEGQAVESVRPTCPGSWIHLLPADYTKPPRV